jgi:probable HAF family extracellular repeat protein
MMKPDKKSIINVQLHTGSTSLLPRTFKRQSESKKWRHMSLILTTWLLTCGASAHAGLTYSIIDLGSLGGGFTTPTSINDAGQIAGVSRLSNGTTSAFFYNQGSIAAIGMAGGTSSYASDINAWGQVVGYSDLGNGITSAFVYSSGTGAIGLGTLGGTSSWASGINDAGQIVGRSQIGGDAASRAFLYQGSMNAIGTLTDAHDINSTGQVLGVEGGSAVIYASGGSTVIGAPPGGCCFAPAAINDFGHLAGTGMPNFIVSDVPHAFYYDGLFKDLGTLNGPGGSDSRGLGINNLGQVVGWSNFHEFDDAFLYSGDSMINLSLLPDVVSSGWRLRQATAINSIGQIVGWGSLNGESNHGFLLSPVDLPEPSNLPLMLGGLGILALIARRQHV